VTAQDYSTHRVTNNAVRKTRDNLRLGRVLQDQVIACAEHVIGQNPKVRQDKGDQHKDQHAIDDEQGGVERREVGKVGARAVGNRAPQQCPE
jgi:hypothetical protein